MHCLSGVVTLSGLGEGHGMNRLLLIAQVVIHKFNEDTFPSGNATFGKMFQYVLSNRLELWRQSVEVAWEMDLEVSELVRVSDPTSNLCAQSCRGAKVCRSNLSTVSQLHDSLE